MAAINIMELIQQYAVIPVAGVCYLVGYLLKTVFENFQNKYIPLALLPVGIFGVLWINAWAVTPEIILSGICSAALAVYIHQNGKQLTNN